MLFNMRRRWESWDTGEQFLLRFYLWWYYRICSLHIRFIWIRRLLFLRHIGIANELTRLGGRLPQDLVSSFYIYYCCSPKSQTYWYLSRYFRGVKAAISGMVISGSNRQDDRSYATKSTNRSHSIVRGRRSSFHWVWSHKRIGVFARKCVAECPFRHS